MRQRQQHFRWARQEGQRERVAGRVVSEGCQSSVDGASRVPPLSPSGSDWESR